MKKSRQNGLDFLKTICALIIVFIHAGFTNNLFGYILRELSRIAVPIFFMISGFFSYNKDIAYFKKSIIKLLKLQISSNILYILYDILKAIVLNESIKELLIQTFNVNYFVFNLGNVGWYIRNLIYIYVIIYFIKRQTNKKINYQVLPIISLFIIVADCIFLKYSKILFGLTYDSTFYEPYTKFISTGLTCFIIGIYINYISQSKKSIFSNKKNLFIMLIFLILNLVEIHILYNLNSNVILCNYLFTIPLSMSIFLLFLNMKMKENKISTIGLKYSTSIYILHPIILNMLDILFKKILKIEGIYIYIRFIVVFLLSLMLAVLYEYIIKKRRNF